MEFSTFVTMFTWSQEAGQPLGGCSFVRFQRRMPRLHSAQVANAPRRNHGSAYGPTLERPHSKRRLAAKQVGLPSLTDVAATSFRLSGGERVLLVFAHKTPATGRPREGELARLSSVEARLD